MQPTEISLVPGVIMKLVIVILILLWILLSCAACGGSGTGDPQHDADNLPTVCQTPGDRCK